MLSVKSRSVSRGGNPEDETGVRHVTVVGKPNVWQAHWYERDCNGKRNQRSKSFSYGTPKSSCLTSEEAKAKAEATRQRKEVDWYIADPQYLNKRKPSYREIFQKDLGVAITEKVNAIGKDESFKKIKSKPAKDAFNRLQGNRYTSVSIEKLLDIAEQLGVQLELHIQPGPAHAE
jgi:hypothetical protein